MPEFKIINHPNDIIPNTNWVESAKFKSKDQIVDAKGKVVTSTITGHQYRLISKKERNFSHIERLGRVFFGTLTVFCSLGGLLLFKSVRKLFTKKTKNLRFGIRFQPPQISPNEAIHSQLAISKKLEEKGIDIPPASNHIELTTFPGRTDKKTIPEPQLSLLPPLLSLSLDPDHELMKEVSPRHFVKDPSMLQILTSGTPQDKKYILSHGLDELLDVSLLVWCGLDAPFDAQARIDDLQGALEAASRAEWLKHLMSAPKRESMITIIHARIEAHNNTIRLNERLRHLHDKVGFLKVRVRDIMNGWENSKLKHALLIDDDLKQKNLREAEPVKSSNCAQ